MRRPSSVGLLEVLRNRRFRRLWIGLMVSAIGDYFFILAVPILIHDLTQSTAAIGLAIIISLALPQLLFGIPAGVLVDRWDRRKVMIAADIIRSVLVLGGLLVHRPQDVWILYGIGLLISTSSRFFLPAQQALIPSLVSEAELVAANGLTQLTMTSAILAGTVLAGLIIGYFGAGAAFVVDALTFLVSAVAVWSIGHVADGRAPQAIERTQRALWSELMDGLRLMFGTQALRGIVMSIAVWYLGFGALMTLWLPFLKQQYQAGPEGISLVLGFLGMGMAVGGAGIGRLATHVGKRTLVTTGTVAIGVVIGLIGSAPSLLFVGAFAFLGGLAFVPVQAGLITLAQQLAPDQTRGRVFGAIGTFGQVALILSIAAAAVLGEVVPLPVIFAGCGGMVVLAGLLFFALVEEPGPEQHGDYCSPATETLL